MMSQSDAARSTATGPDDVGAQTPATGRTVLVVTHAGRERAVHVASALFTALTRRGLAVAIPADELGWQRDQLSDLGVHVCSTPQDIPDNCDLVVVVGGDGTILRASEWAYRARLPLLGVNLGHVGFLAEVEPENVAHLVEAVARRDYTVEERTTLEIRGVVGGEVSWQTWALNEVSVEKISRERMLDVVLEVDRRPLSRWGCDGVICATPTGSTAYSWSAGGPVVWPQVEAMVVVPLSAHALFSRPLVVAKDTHVAVELPAEASPAVAWCDGRRMFEVPAGGRVEVTTSPTPLRFARIHHASFTDRLVRKFDLPVAGWRGAEGDQ